MLPKPSWLRIKASNCASYENTHKLLRSLECTTVCEAAACPNARECWAKSHAAFMILGDVCTRRCKFCNVKKGAPGGIVDSTEPAKIAQAVAKLKLKHVVITSVTRDDLPDGGAEQFVKCIEQIRAINKQVVIEILTPDFRKKLGAVEKIVAALPDVFNHNLEIVPRLYKAIRPVATYEGSLALLRQVKGLNASIFTKSGLMLGLGETIDEVLQVMDDMRSAGIDFLVLGQYLQPSKKHAPVVRYVHPDEFNFLAEQAKEKGFLMVSASPFARSSFHAHEDFEKLRRTASE